MKESKDTDPGQEKKTQAGKDTQNSGKSTAQDDGSTAGPPVIWNRKMPEDVVLPASYDYREHGRAPKIGNQGSLGTCWAFASLTALESTLLPDQKETFSVDHMSMHNHFLLGQDEGGEYTMSMAYLLSWEGPVWESEGKRFCILPYFRRYCPFRAGCFSTSVQDLTGIKALQYPCSADPSVHSIPYPFYYVFNESLLHLHSKGIRGSSDRRRMQQLPALHTDHPSYQ